MHSVAVTPEWPVLTLRRNALGVVSSDGPLSAEFGNSTELSGVHADPFAAWRVDGESLTAQTDRYGFFPMFYYAWDGGIMVSPSLHALVLAGAPTVIDATAVGVLLRAGFMVGDDTPFRDIRLLPPGGTLTWTPTSFSVQGSITFGRNLATTRTAAIDEYIERFRASIARRPARGTSIVPLSGGRDSRHIFLELWSSGRAPDVALTIGGWDGQSTPDVDSARALAERAGVRHVMLPRAPRWQSSLATVCATHLCTLEHWAFQSLTEHLRDREGDITVYEGVAGDVLSTNLYKTPRKQQLYEERSFEALAEEFMSDEGYLPKILPEPWYRLMGRSVARCRLARELALHADAPNPLASFLFYNRARRVTSLPPASLYSPHATVWCPFLDGELWDFLASLPAHIVQGDSKFSFHHDAIVRAYPRFADIPFAGKYALRARARERSTAIEMGRDVARKAPILVRKRFLGPRIVRGLIDPTYSAEIAKMAQLVSYLTQLSRFAAGPDNDGRHRVGCDY
jgi:asparagine synthase (glutamine-hydrolysing)